MDTNEYQKQTNSNIREKADLIWQIATHLYGEYKPHEYGRVILPMTVVKRFDDCLKATKVEVLKQAKAVENMAAGTKDAVLKATSKYSFYNTSKFDFDKLLGDSVNIASNFIDYLAGFSDNVKAVISYFEFDKEIAKMSQNDLLFSIVTEFNSKKADMSPDKITSQDMGYVFEELIRKFSESYDEQAGAHFTARDIIYLMAELLIAPEKTFIAEHGCNKTAYDMTMGTSQMLACLDERLKAINPNVSLICYGQEFNPETFAIAKADMLIKGGDSENMKFGDTLSNDQFEDFHFDYIISNPPFGIDWKKEKNAVEKEAKREFEGRFGPGLPSIADGQMLFLLNGVKKLKENGRMAIIQNGSSLFSGDAGSGPSEIRKYLIENDFLEAIIQLPSDLFYNTGISTFIWVVTRKKSSHRIGKIQLIDASNCFVKRRKSIGNKKVDLDDDCIEMLLKTYNGFSKSDETSPNDERIFVESKVFDNNFFGYTKIVVDSPVCDETGKPILKKGKIQVNTSLRDSEVIPLKENIDDFIKKNVTPFKSNIWIDTALNKIGYKIPFTRLFYKFLTPKNSKDIIKDILKLEENEAKLMKEFFENE